MADLSISSGIDRLISWDPHSKQLHGFYGATPLNLLDPLSLFVEEFKQFENRDDVIAIAPDAGASKFVTHFARALGMNSAIASKYRPSNEEVVTSEIIGDFTGKRMAIILDDIISSGKTIQALVKKLVADKKIEEMYLGISHCLCAADAVEMLRQLHGEHTIKQVVVTNSIPQTREVTALPFLKVCDLSGILSRTINRIHYNRSVSEIFYES
jgi:ribose-phosphate pyrophosphokinase